MYLYNQIVFVVKGRAFGGMSCINRHAAPRLAFKTPYYVRTSKYINKQLCGLNSSTGSFRHLLILVDTSRTPAAWAASTIV